jgi:Mrp family chromosome partitioning ATPase
MSPTELLGLENSVGLMTVLIGRSTLDEATQPHASGINFLGTGPRPPNPAEVLDTQAMRDLLQRAGADYDVVILDAPPMLPVADASILMREVDGALMLVRYGSTTREQLRLAVARIETVGGRLFGTILNRTPRRLGDVYGYGYGYGYGEEPAEPSSRLGWFSRADHDETPVRRAVR